MSLATAIDLAEADLSYMGAAVASPLGAVRGALGVPVPAVTTRGQLWGTGAVRPTLLLYDRSMGTTLELWVSDPFTTLFAPDQFTWNCLGHFSDDRFAVPDTRQQVATLINQFPNGGFSLGDPNALADDLVTDLDIQNPYDDPEFWDEGVAFVVSQWERVRPFAFRAVLAQPQIRHVQWGQTLVLETGGPPILRIVLIVAHLCGINQLARDPAEILGVHVRRLAGSPNSSVDIPAAAATFRQFLRFIRLTLRKVKGFVDLRQSPFDLVTPIERFDIPEGVESVDPNTPMCLETQFGEMAGIVPSPPLGSRTVHLDFDNSGGSQLVKGVAEPQVGAAFGNFEGYLRANVDAEADLDVAPHGAERWLNTLGNRIGDLE